MNPHRRAFITSLVLLAAAGAVAGTSASFNAKTRNDAAFSTDGLNNPSNVVATVAGNTVAWSWTAGSLNSGGSDFRHRLSTKALAAGTLAGTAPACTWTDTFTTSSTIPNATTSTSIATSAANAGAWLCWRLDVQSPAATPTYFSQSSPTGAVKVGHAMASVAIANGGAAGDIDAGDTITISFTQPVLKSTTSTAASVCAIEASKVIYVGRTQSGSTTCSAVTPLVGPLTASNVVAGKGTHSTPAYDATFTWQGTCNAGNTACDQLLVTIGARGNGNKDATVTLSSTLFDPVSTLTSASGTALCTTANNTSTPVICHPQITGSF